MEPRDVSDYLRTILLAHGITASLEPGPLHLEETALTMQALAYERPTAQRAQLQLDIIVRDDTLLGDRAVVESFAGVGATFADALQQAFDKFCRASLHVLLAVFVSVELGGDQVEWERWSNATQTWDVCLGPLLIQATNPPGTQAPELNIGDLLDAIRALIVAEASPGIHWFRVYYMARDGTCLGSEALLDNANWPQAQGLIDTWPWPSRSDIYALRHFFIAKPVDTGEA